MERIFKCTDCKKELKFFEIHTIPGREINDLDLGLKYGTEQKFCKECYKNRLNIK